MRKKHVHKYQRIKLPKGKFIFRCMLPDCSHYLFEEFILGKSSICWYCGNPFTIDKTQRERARPHCGCRNAEPDDSVDKYVEEILK
jgi:hypothetical protein